LGTEREIFFSKDGGATFESGFSLPLFSEEGLEFLDEDFDENESKASSPRFTSFAFSLKEPFRIWVGTREGVFESHDGALSWEKLAERGLKDRYVLDLAFSEAADQLIAATSSGVVRFHPVAKHWEAVSMGLSEPPRSLALRSFEEEEILLVASGAQVYEWKLIPLEAPFSEPHWIPSPERLDLLKKLISLEPTVQEVHKRAIHYGNLGNGRIKRWHWASRLRALIPAVSFGKDFSLSANVDIDRGSTNEPDRFIVGPADEDKGWDLGIRWELGDLLFSTAQTAIDSRAKLLVELRESILSQVTRIYFERRRIQMEIVLAAPERSLEEHLDLLLRLDELTAQIDGLTEGFLSDELQ
jgi:hypothetical protein